MHLFRQRLQLHLRCKSRNINALISRMDLIFQGGNTHHEKFIQIGLRNGQKLQSLKKRHNLCISGFA